MKGDITGLLGALDRGDADAGDQLVALLYDELHGIAEAVMRGERSDHTLSATGLLHETYLRLVDAQSVGWQDRTHFLAVASRVMRRVLVDHARRRAAAKRGGGDRVTLRDDLVAADERPFEILALDEALSRLEKRDERRARIVEMRFFSGLEVAEIAALLGISEATVKRDWRFARAWLLAELSP